MLFNSTVFLYAFLPATYFVHTFLKQKNSRYIWLTFTGYIFYGFWNYKFCFLMAFSTLVSFIAGLGFLRWHNVPSYRKLCLIIPITADLCLLGFFKYFNFFIQNIGGITETFFGLTLQQLDIILPVGISFYTFHTISYIVDCYRNVVRPTRNFFEFSCYVSLFSQLVAGPIVRFGQIERDLENIDRFKRTKNVDIAWSFFVIGIIKKVIIADSIALIIDPAFKHYDTLSTFDTWLIIFGYTYQLYFDFSGYSDMAVGLGHLFNIHIPQNFNSPYKAINIPDFWRRWHISLSSCLRDYLYIPLGGNRNGGLKVYRNLMITMGFGGLWHGANWTFVVWGIYHGILLSISRILPKKHSLMPHWIDKIKTFLLVVIGWVFFRSQDMHMASSILKKMFGFHNGIGLEGRYGLLSLIAIAFCIAHFCKNTFELSHKWSNVAAFALIGLFAVTMLFIISGRSSPFLYFQF